MDYREQLASVLQENFLFDGTIAENVGYAKPGATLDEIKDACRIAHCDEFISQFPQGYDTVVGERGIKLSGGQRQRVSIARAILANPRILILDEATSSLDSESEQMIQDGLRRLRSGRTTFVIAHRLSTIRSADQILVLEAGEIVERGTHAELLALGGRYRQLYDKQYNFESGSLHQPGRGLHAGAREAGGGCSAVGRNSVGAGMTMDESALLNGVLRSVLGGRGRRRRSGRALNYLTGGGRGSFWTNPTTLLTAAGVAWGIFETMQHSRQLSGPAGIAPAFRGFSAVCRLAGRCADAAGVPSGVSPEALRIVRLAISAAYADGSVSDTERAAILDQAQTAGVAEIVEAELQQPRPLAEIVSGVSDPAQRATMYVLALQHGARRRTADRGGAHLPCAARESARHRRRHRPGARTESGKPDRRAAGR